MNLPQERLTALIEFAKQTALLKKTPLQQVTQHKDFLRLEEKLQGLPGLSLNAARADFDEVWLRLERLVETAPPTPGSPLLALWVELSKSPFKEPALKAQIARQALLDIGALAAPALSVDSPADTTPTPEPAPFVALHEFPDLAALQAQLKAYRDTVWQVWAEREGSAQEHRAVCRDLHAGAKAPGQSGGLAVGSGLGRGHGVVGLADGDGHLPAANAAGGDIAR